MHTSGTYLHNVLQELFQKKTAQHDNGVMDDGKSANTWLVVQATQQGTVSPNYSSGHQPQISSFLLILRKSWATLV